ncbi:Nodulation protein V [Fibrella aestuarina BUZ 2]|uniref:histidine kinase n=1 Tax=Fibrella aestuarina BUZ 2 TaxID=1166018 RepID=I0KF06_9BACT|nr:PAS domain S-box protein [Fibrella aestuarina]CCH02709.1 Nodulation protein V [Fibrella aestuarina BUZ 2]
MDQLLQVWFNTSSQGVAFLEPIRNNQKNVVDFRYKLANPAFVTICQTSLNELIDLPVSKLLQPGQEALFLDPIIAVFQTGQPQQLSNQYWLHGEPVWHDITLSRTDQLVMVTVQDISEQKRSEHRLQRHLAIASILSAVSSRFITLQANEVDSCIVEALGQVSNHIGAQRASVFTYTSDYEAGRCIYEWCAPGIEPRKERVQARPKECFDWMQPQLEKGETVCLRIDELGPEHPRERAFFSFIAVKSMVAVPLVQQGKTQGFIGFYTIDEPYTWAQNDVALLATFGTLVANVLYRLQQEAAIRRVSQRLEGLHAIDHALLSYRMADQSPLQIAMQYLHFMVACSQITVFQMEADLEWAVAKCQAIDGALNMTPTVRIPAAFLQQWFEQDQPKVAVYHPDLQQLGAAISPALPDFPGDFQSQVIIPLYSQAKCIGVLWLLSTDAYFFSEDDRQVAQELAGPLAIVLHQQQLDEQIKRHTEQLEQQVEERTQEVRQLSTLHQAILRHAGQAIISTDIHGVIQTANQACELLLGYRIDELIGRTVYLQPGPPTNPLPVVTYRMNGRGRPLTDFFAESLATQGYFYCECVTLTKTGQRTPILLAASALQANDGTIIGYVGLSTDISALKTAEINLQRKNQELNTFFHGALDMHCISDSRGNISDVNQAFQETLGYAADELKSIPFLQLIHPDEQKFVYANLLVPILQKPVRNQINRMRRKDGHYRIIEWNAIGINHVVYGSARDITQRQEVEMQLRGLNERLKLATQAAGQGIWEVDVQTNRLFWDERAYEIYGIPTSQTTVYFDDYLRLIHPDDLAAFWAQYNRDIEGDTITNVARIIRPDGELRYIKVNGNLIRNKRGDVVRHIGVIWDVTEQVLAEEALRESEQRFREIAENVDEIFWIHSVEPFQLLYINPTYERVWHRSCQSLYNDTFSFLPGVYEEDMPIVGKAITQYLSGKESQIQCRRKNADGSLSWVSVRTFIIRNEAGKPIRQIGIANDITDQKEKELLLQQALVQEQQLNHLKSQFVSTASHEFRTPLATIQSSVDLIKLYLNVPDASASIQKHLGVIEKEILQFSGLLTDMLTISRIEAGKIQVNPKLIDPILVAQNVINTHFSQRSDHRSVDFTVEGTPYPVCLDEKLMSHVIVNVLSNAFKFSKTNPTLRLSFQDDKHLLIQVTDTGIGIPTNELSMLFQAFFRASNANGVSGTGLGLVISRQFVELHGGQLTIQSEEKKGTCCTITLPVDAPEGAFGADEVITHRTLS